jgi:hypothetical protein
MPKFIVLDADGTPTPDGPFPTWKDAKNAVVKRESHDSRVGQSTNYQILEVE